MHDSKTVRSRVAGLRVHETHKQVWYRFLLLIGVIVAYVAILSFQYGFTTGGVVSLITWSFFVLCTPIADAGMLLDFPLRLLLNIRMIKSEIVVWVIAMTLNIGMIRFAPQLYDTTLLTRIFREILITPFPYWCVIGLSAVGTFLSVIFADELLDVVKHHDRKIFHRYQFWVHMTILLLVVVLLVVLYDMLIQKTGLQDILKQY